MKKLKPLHKRQTTKRTKSKKRVYVRKPKNKVPEKRKYYIYPTRTCQHIDDNGERCTKKAVGKDPFCKKHGGNPIIRENLVPDKKIPQDIITKTKFKPDYHPKLYVDLSRQGNCEAEIATIFDVSLNTLHKWAETYESFNDAHERGAAAYESWWLSVGKGGLRDRAFNTQLFKYITMNKLRYSDKVESTNTTTHNFGVLVIPAQKSKEEWEELDDSDIIDI